MKDSRKTILPVVGEVYEYIDNPEYHVRIDKIVAKKIYYTYVKVRKGSMLLNNSFSKDNIYAADLRNVNYLNSPLWKKLEGIK